jgi:hypothetical protein
MMTIDDYKSLTDPTFVRPENYYIVCGNYSEYIKHVNAKHTFKPLDKRLLFVADSTIFRGTVNPEGIFIGTWRDRLDIKHLLDVMYTCMSDPIKKDKIRQLKAEFYK